MWVLIVKQKTAYERRSSDWSSDVCSSDLQGDDPQARRVLVGDEDELRPCVADIGPVILQLRDQRARRGAGLRQIDERDGVAVVGPFGRSEEHTSELQSLMRISYAVFCLKKKKTQTRNKTTDTRRII